jgi:phage head maturation protease
MTISTRRLHAPTTDTRFFDGAPKSFDAENRTCDAILSTGSEVRRFYGRERLRIDSKSVDLSRVRAGQVPLLDSHDQSSITNALGRVQTAWVAGGALMAKLRFNKTAEGRKAMGMVSRGEVSGISCGYTVDDWEISNDDGDILDPDKDRIRYDDDLIFTAVSWRLHEASLVSVPADSTASVRSRTVNASYRDMPVPVSDEISMRLRRLEARMSGRLDYSPRAVRARMQARYNMTMRGMDSDG